jgi:hypothetical protein
LIPNGQKPLQVVDNRAAADFMLIDDSGSAGSCCDGEHIRINGGVAHPALDLSLSRTPPKHKIYVRFANFSEHDAAALFAVMWRKAHGGPATSRKIAARN